MKEGRNGRGGPNELEVAVAAYQIEITNSRSREAREARLSAAPSPPKDNNINGCFFREKGREGGYRWRRLSQRRGGGG